MGCLIMLFGLLFCFLGHPIVGICVLLFGVVCVTLEMG